MIGAPVRGTAPRRPRRPRQRRGGPEPKESEEKRPKVNPIFLWASQQEQRIVEVRCEDYDKRNRIKLTKTAQGWRSIPRTALNMYSSVNRCKSTEKPTKTGRSEKENGDELTEAEPTKEGNVQDPTRGTSEQLNGTRTHYGAPMDLPSLQKYRTDLEKAQNDQLFQPRVVLEQLHLPRLPDSVHQSLLEQMGEQDDTGSEEKTSPEVDREDLQDILNMLDATASPAMATDTASPDLPSPNSPKTVDNFKLGGLMVVDVSRGQRSMEIVGKPVEGEMEQDDTVYQEFLDEDPPDQSKIQDDCRSSSYRDFPTRSARCEGTRRISGTAEEGLNLANEGILPSALLKKLPGIECMPAEAPEGGSMTFKRGSETIYRRESHDILGGHVAPTETSSLLKWQNAMVMTPVAGTGQGCRSVQDKIVVPSGNPARNDFGDSTRILDALRNTPGLSVSIAGRNNPTEDQSDSPLHCSPSPNRSKKSLVMAKGTTPKDNHPMVAKSDARRPPPGLLLSISNGGNSVQNSVNSSQSVSISPNASQSSCNGLGLSSRGSMQKERWHKNPQNLPGLSISIPSYQYRSKHTTSLTISPESTVAFPKLEVYSDEAKPSLEEVLHEEDDCDSQVLEDLRRQNNQFSSRGKTREPGATRLRRFQDSDHLDERVLEDLRSQGTLITQSGLFSPQSRSSETSTRSTRLQDLEHFDEQVLDELRSQGTVVSPQPSGIPWSPTPRRTSSAYLERLLPSPPCSVSCSEDAKNDLTLKGILASPNRLDKDPSLLVRKTGPGKPPPPSNARDPENGSQDPSIQGQRIGNTGRPATRTSTNDYRTTLARYQNHEIRNSGRPMSSGDIHSAFPVDHVPPKRPTSAEQTKAHARPSFLRSTRKPRFYELEEAKDPASQLRELIRTSGHLIPDPLLVPRDYLPALAAAPATEIPRLLVSRPELRLAEALNRPEFLKDPDLLVISLAHLQHVLDHGEGPVSRMHGQARVEGTSGPHSPDQTQPKLSCKPIGTLMPAPIDLSANKRASPYPPLLRVRSGLLKQEPEVTSTAVSPEDHLWHPLFGSQKRQQQQHGSWHRTTMAYS